MLEKETKKDAEITADSENVSTEEKKSEDVTEEEPSQKNEQPEESDNSEEWTPPSKDEWEKIHKKAIDFDGLIEKQKIERLKKKKQEKSKDDDVETIINQKVQEAVSKIVPPNTNVDEAFGEWVKTNSWASTDKLDVIRESLNLSGNETKETVVAKLNIAAQNAFPVEFWEETQKRITVKSTADAHKLNVVDSSTGGGNSEPHNSKEKPLTAEQIRLAALCGNKPEEVYKN